MHCHAPQRDRVDRHLAGGAGTVWVARTPGPRERLRARTRASRRADPVPALRVADLDLQDLLGRGCG